MSNRRTVTNVDGTVDVVEDYDPDAGDELIYLGGKPLTSAYAEQLAEEAERGFDPASLVSLGGRPSLSDSGDSPQLRFRLAAEKRAKIEHIASQKHTSVSHILREAVDRYLEAA